MPRHVSLGRFVRHACLGVLGAGALGSIGAGCLDRPVVPSSPVTTARFVAADTQKGVDKIDLLFMIDNSSSMADKQQILAGTDAQHPGAVVDLVNRLVNPRCVDAVDQTKPAVTQPAKPTDACPAGSVREFEPIKDIHIGLISSSIGGHGADTCSPALPTQWEPTMMDMSHLLARKLGGGTVPTYKDPNHPDPQDPNAASNFLFWDPDGKGEPTPEGGEQPPVGEANLATLEQNFQEMTLGVDQTGCGFEASLEAVYRFLADPNPYHDLSLDGQALKKNGTDDTLLAQRAAFLRPDSLLAIVSLSDENDCSVREDDGQNYYIVIQSTSGKKQFRMFRATSECETNPNDKCCTSCALPAPDGCTPHDQDSSCTTNGGKYTDAEDALNLRCWDQKRRFGVDFLYPTQRYVDMILSPTIEGQPNPLYQNLQGTSVADVRSPQDVFWAQIVGVPWQDIAVDPTDLKKGYLGTTPNPDNPGDPNNFIDKGTWDVLLGDSTKRDPLMIESVDPRQGTYPIFNEPLVQPSSTATTPPALDPKLPNGHEWDISAHRDDLQYACIFDLPAPRSCATDPKDCDCATAPADNNQNPLCQDPTTNAVTTTQFRAKGYPGTRHLAVAQGLGAQGIVASICPANLADANADDYGYRPAVGAIIDRLKSRLKGKCLNRRLQPSVCPGAADYGQVPCVVLEVTKTGGGTCDCSRPGRKDPKPETETDEVKAAGDCICEIQQLSGGDLQTCQTDTGSNPGGGSLTGFCYVDPGAGIGAADLVKKCASNQQRILRFVGNETPAKGSTVFYACQEAAFDPSAGADGGGVSAACGQ